MKRDQMICKRILLQILQNGHFVSETKEEAYHVALLADRGYIEAKIEKDELGTPIKATVGRLTAVGHDALDAELTPPSAPPPNNNFNDKYYDILADNKHRNESARDKMLAVISTGGIGLLFGIASYLKTNGKDFEMLPWYATLVLWGLVLIGLLVSDHLGGKAVDKPINQLGSPDADVMHNYTPLEKCIDYLNAANCFLSIFGIATFAWFLVKLPNVL